MAGIDEERDWADLYGEEHRFRESFLRRDGVGRDEGLLR
jgi:hypothetical protein